MKLTRSAKYHIQTHFINNFKLLRNMYNRVNMNQQSDEQPIHKHLSNESSEIQLLKQLLIENQLEIDQLHKSFIKQTQQLHRCECTIISHRERDQEFIDQNMIINRLEQSIQTLQSLNVSLQIENSHLKKQTIKQCDHQDECGCEMDVCNKCKQIQLHQCTICDSQSLTCDQCAKHVECDNNNCAFYYRDRFHKCICLNEYCIYCNIKKRKAEFPCNEIEYGNIRQRHNNQADQIAADQLNEYQAFLLNTTINSNVQYHDDQQHI